jgi:ribose-phosphate pyrophosphokinase
MVFTGNANPELARKVASRLYLSLGKADVGRFSDGEIAVELNENVRGKDVFVLQPTCAPTNDNLMELLVMIDALRRASAGASRRWCPTSATRGRIAGCARRGYRSRPRSWRT